MLHSALKNTGSPPTRHIQKHPEDNIKYQGTSPHPEGKPSNNQNSTPKGLNMFIPYTSYISEEHINIDNEHTHSQVTLHHTASNKPQTPPILKSINLRK